MRRISCFILAVLLSAGMMSNSSAGLLFSLDHNDLPDSGMITEWGDMTAMLTTQNTEPDGTGSWDTVVGPSVEIIDGVKWSRNTYQDAGPFYEDPPESGIWFPSNADTQQFDGYRHDTYQNVTDPIPINGATIVTATSPIRTDQPTPWSSIVDVFYSALVLGVRNDDGRIIVKIANDGGGPDNPTHVGPIENAIPEERGVLSLSVSNTGAYEVYWRGESTPEPTLMMSGQADLNGTDFDELVPNLHGIFAHAINIGRNNPDGWTAFNGLIGDTYVYGEQLSTAEREALELKVWQDMGIGEAEISGIAAPRTAGFFIRELKAGDWQLVGLPFNQISDEMVALADVLGTVGFVNGTEVMAWDGTGYAASSFFLGTWSGNIELRRGQGFWIKSPVDTDLYLLGQVPVEADTAIELPRGLQLISAPYPATIDLNDEEILLSVPFNGDQIFFLGEGSGYTSNAYFMGTWSGAGMLEPGKGYWYDSVDEQDMLIGIPY